MVYSIHLSEVTISVLSATFLITFVSISFCPLLTEITFQLHRTYTCSLEAVASSPGLHTHITHSSYSKSWSLNKIIDILEATYDDVIKWKNLTRYWPFVRSPVNSPHNGQWRVALVFSLICAWMNGSVSNREAGDLKSHLTHHDVTVMITKGIFLDENVSLTIQILLKLLPGGRIKS